MRRSAQNPLPSRLNQWLAGLLFLMAIPLIFHFAFSWMGFNPTDDGFILSASRRVLEGQIPHRDFISVHPAGSYYLHAPILFLGGNSTVWLSRGVVWFEFACIAWSWVVVLNRLLELRLAPHERFLYALPAFLLSSHTFPIMAWHSIDALFLASGGLALCTSSALEEQWKSKLPGYLLLGASVLCRLNFLPLILGTVFLLRDQRKLSVWIAAVLPGIAYIAFFQFAGALDDAFSQLVTQTDLLATGFGRYVQEWSTPVGVMLGYWAGSLIYFKNDGIGSKAPKFRKSGGFLILFFVSLFASLTLGWIDADNPMSAYLWNANIGKYLWTPSFLLSGAVLGLALFSLLDRPGHRRQLLTACSLTLLTAWCVSISIGCNSPVLANGPLVLLLLAWVRFALSGHTNTPLLQKAHTFAVLLLLQITLISYVIARRAHVYEDRPASDLRYSVGSVLPGFDHIQTNANTFAFLADLNVALKQADGLAYAILPDLEAWWIKSRQLNPLPLDWPQGIQLGSNLRSIDRVLEALNQHRKSGVVIVQKVTPYLMAYDYRPLFSEGFNDIVDYVHANCEKISETEFFEIYK